MSRHSRHWLLGVLLLWLWLAGCAEKRRVLSPEFEGLPDAPERIRPLVAGEPVPEILLRDSTDSPVELARLGPSVLIFYRGGWCPYCNAHLGELRLVEKELQKLGYQVVAISPDKPEHLAATRAARRVDMLFLSDAEMAAAIAFGVAYIPDARSLGLLRVVGVDLAERSGHAHYLLPVPSVFVTDRDGRIAFVHADPDYRRRLDRHRLLRAAHLAARR